ncbi:MAG: hypothetical protein HBSAPP03_11040 [Phycisphaerae bacterium]|nr:MAG: hypothetical protein HBSAPP03_11040 [Phycisphaerae bacterium]
MPEPTAAVLRHFPCRQCGAKVEFAPGTTSLVCPYCQTHNDIMVEGKAEELDFVATLASLEQAAPHVSVRVMKCQACAAEVTVGATTTSLMCSFCGTNIVSQIESASRVKPNGVLPFAIAREKAVDSFRSWLKSRWFAPGALKGQSLIDEQLSGVYLPAWTYDCKADTSYSGQRGDAYYVTVGSGKNRRTERRIRWRSVSGRVHDRFDDVLVLASQSLEPKMIRALEPWDLKAVKPYADEFLAGFRAECYQIDLKGGWSTAQQIMAPTIDATIRSDIGGDEQRITWKHSAYSAITFKYLLLPVWVSAYRYKGKVYRFLVNARTGEVQGQRPYSPWKIAGVIVLGLIVIGAIILFVSRQ